MVSIQSTTKGLPDINESTLKLAETKDLIADMIDTLSGFDYVKKGTVMQKVRLTKPTFTHEFCKEIQSLVRIAINKVTGRTTFKDDDINKLSLNFGMSLLEYLGCKGFENYITDEIWGIAKEYANNEKLADEYSKLIDDSDSEDLKEHYAKELMNLIRFPKNLKFDEKNDDFTVKHMDFIVKKEGITVDRAGAKQVLSTLLWTIMPFFEGGLRKSESGLTLNYEKGIVKETITPGVVQQDNSTSGLNGAKNKMFGGNS